MFYWWGFQPNSLTLGVSCPFLLQDTFPLTVRRAEADRTFPGRSDVACPAIPPVSHRNHTDSTGLEAFFSLSMLKVTAPAHTELDWCKTGVRAEPVLAGDGLSVTLLAVCPGIYQGAEKADIVQYSLCQALTQPLTLRREKYLQFFKRSIFFLPSGFLDAPGDCVLPSASVISEHGIMVSQPGL